MRAPGGSRTAEIVCLARALAGVDPFAFDLLTARPGRRWLKALQPAQRLPLRALSPLTGGLVATVAGRTRTFDQHLLDALGAGATQLILLGAGLDARPWRMGPVLTAARTFVVDHPASAAMRARAAGGLPPTDAVRVDVDFAQEALAPALGAAGVASDQPSVVVWEGVSMYLVESAVRQTLRSLRACLAPGSTLIFDVWCPSNDWRAGLEQLGRVGLRWLGEPLDFSLPVDDVERFLASEGLTLRSLTSAVEAGRRWGGAGLPGLWFVCAQV